MTTLRRSLVGLLALLLLSGTLGVSVGTVAVTGTPGGTSNANAQSLTLNYTVAAGTTLMVVHYGFSSIARTVDSATWNGGAISAGTRKAGTSYGSVETYYKVNPAVGTYDLYGHWNTSGQCIMQVVTYSGANTSSLFGTPVTAETTGDTHVSTTCTSTTGGLVDIALNVASGSITPTDDGGQVSRKIDTLPSNAITLASSTETGAASVTSGYTWTGSQSAQIILTPINPAPSVPKTKLMTLLGVGE